MTRAVSAAAFLLAVLTGEAASAQDPISISVTQASQDIAGSVACALQSAIGTAIPGCPNPLSALPTGCTGVPTSVIGALQCLDGDTGAQITKLGQIVTQAMDGQGQSRTVQDNTALLGREAAKFQISPTRCTAVAAGAVVADGEASMQQILTTAATAQANRSLAASGTAPASGQAAAVAELAKAHAAVPAAGVQLPDGSGSVTDLSAAALFSDQQVPAPAGVTVKSNATNSLAELFIQHSFNPKPPPPQRNKTEQAEIAEARNSRAARMDLALSVPLDLLARQAPNYSDSLRSILPPVVQVTTPAGTKLSWNELMRYSIEGRYANKQWYDTVQTMSDQQRQSEALYMQALELYLDLYQSRFEEKVAVAAAALYAGGIDAMPGSSAGEINPSLAREP